MCACMPQAAPSRMFHAPRAIYTHTGYFHFDMQYPHVAAVYWSLYRYVGGGLQQLGGDGECTFRVLQ